MKLFAFAIVILTALLLATAPVFAQTETPPQSETLTWSGAINGLVVNRTPGGQAPGELDLMLHAWDENLNERLMLDARSAPNGAFQFSEVTFDPALLYAVMLTYEDVVYYSPPARVEAGQTALDLQVPVYETTADTTAVVVDRMHVFFDAAPGGLLVGEIYILSNLSDRTVARALTLSDGVPATFEFPLPENAADISFENDAGRYVLTPDGFADTAPLPPGDGSGQVVVTYTLPYADGMTYTQTAQFPTGGVNLLLPVAIGLSLDGPGFTPTGVREMGAGLQVEVFTRDSLEPGETISATLTGEPVVRAGNVVGGMTPELPARQPSRLGIAVGGAALGLALLVVGVWWYRRLEIVPVEMPSGAAFDELVTEIAALDEAHERGELDGAEFRTQRAALVQRAKGALSAEEVS